MKEEKIYRQEAVVPDRGLPFKLFRFEGADGKYIREAHRLEEKALHPVAIVAVNAQASLAADGPHIKECVDRFWNTPLRTGDRRYYDNFLYLFAMLALSGNYRIYK